MAYVFIGLFIILQTNKGSEIFWINQFHHPILDTFFSITTYLGDGVFITLILVGLLFRNWKLAITLGIVSILNGVIINLLKRQVFYMMDRPAGVLDISKLHICAPELHKHFSFPSGHTGGAFTFLFSIAIISKNTTVQVVCAVLAIIAAISRMYLIQHFLMDTVAAAALSTTLTLVWFWIIKTYTPLKTTLYDN